MIKKIVFMFLVLSGSIFALTFDAVVPLSGSANPAGIFYTKVPKLPSSMKLLFGLSAVVPGRKAEELDVDLKLGFNKDIVILGNADVYFSFNNHDGVIRTGDYRGSDFYTQSLNIAKTWKYPLTDRVDIGITAVLGELLLNGEYQLNVLSQVNPVIGMKISIF